MFDKYELIVYNAKKGCDILEKESTYIIYTDASFDDFTKVGTYAVIVMQGNSVLKRTAKRCRIQMKSSTECEIFAVYQAINIILNMYVKNGKKQKFKLRTDSIDAKDFFADNNYTSKVFLDNSELSMLMRKTYKTVCKKILKEKGDFSITWIPREANKMAHKWSYIVFQRIRGDNEKKEILLIDKESFFKLLSNKNKRQNEIIKYLFCNSDEHKLIIKTQKEMADTLNMPISVINKNLKELIELDVLEKVQNGKYVILI
ncbi:MAG TPA: hypothetical protein DCZ30_06845 [Clostridiales bacterium]|nr:hypothetical protein [Clostridiales bacterium]